MMKKSILNVALLLLSACASAPVAPLIPLSPEQVSVEKWGRTPDCCVAKGKRFAIASGGSHASRIGLEIAQKGGNLFDMAVAVGFALAVERVDATGIGGGGFALVRPVKGDPEFLDFRETAPGAATRDLYLDDSGEVEPGMLSREGIFAVATPGFVAGMAAIYRKGAALPWQELLQPAIALAEEGFSIYPVLAEELEGVKKSLSKSLAARQVFFNGKRPKGLGEKLVQADLGKSLRLIADEGAEVFYRGSLSKLIVSTSKQYGGLLKAEDLEKYTVKSRVPLSAQVGEYTYFTAPPPSAGGVILLQVMKVWGELSQDQRPRSEVQYAHFLSEVFKRAYAERSDSIGDPDFVSVPTERLVSDAFAKALKSKVDWNKATPSEKIKPGTAGRQTHGTTGFVILDASGAAISATLTLNTRFGSKVMVPKTGILLNNEMDDFSIKAGVKNAYGLTGSEANAIAAYKRPVSSMTPTIVLKNGRPVLGVSGAGGSRIITSVVQTVLNYTSIFPEDLRRAVFSPRMHHQWLPDKLDLESGFLVSSKEQLKQMGYKVSDPDWNAKIVAVGKVSDEWVAVADPREEGGVSGK
jgi:gamma-glutamyltranspeptidase / glutathione hydrolase